MRPRLAFYGLQCPALFPKNPLLALSLLTSFLFAPAAVAANTRYVNGVNGSDGNSCTSPQSACKTITQAILLASRGDSIMVAAATYRENLTMPFGLNIIGAGAATTILDGGGAGSVIFSDRQDVTISNVTLRNGTGDGGTVGDGGNVYNCFGSMTISNSVLTGGRAQRARGFDGFGGAIYNCPSSVMTIVNSTLIGNSAEEGGAICNGGFLTIVNSTFTGNTARRYKGGAIRNYGVLRITNSTISGNRAEGIGGGIHNGALFGPSGDVEISSSTLSGNSAGNGQGGGIFSDKEGTRVVLQNTIVANNDRKNCGGLMSSRGYNLSSDESCGLGREGDLNAVDPRLGPLQDNGGPTQTMALLSDSPAVDAGNPNGCIDSQGNLLTTDQRGEPRPDKEDASGCDVGAYERQSD